MVDTIQRYCVRQMETHARKQGSGRAAIPGLKAGISRGELW